MKKHTEEFWSLYDHYVHTGDTTSRHHLSELLRIIEKPDRRTQILRPEKNWKEIIAWQVLRNQQFIFSDRVVNHLYEGEVIAWSPHWDRDIFLTRIPIEEKVSGRYIKPGYVLKHEDKKDNTDYEWEQTVLRYGLTDERGLYLPLFDVETLLKLCDRQISLIKPSIKESIVRNLSIHKSDIEKL